MPPRGRLNSFYSGIYQIFGFTHKITTSELSTKLTLVKTPLVAPINSEEGQDSLEIPRLPAHLSREALDRALAIPTVPTPADPAGHETPYPVPPPM